MRPSRKQCDLPIPIFAKHSANPESSHASPGCPVSAGPRSQILTSCRGFRFAPSGWGRFWPASFAFRVEQLQQAVERHARRSLKIKDYRVTLHEIYGVIQGILIACSLLACFTLKPNMPHPLAHHLLPRCETCFTLKCSRIRCFVHQHFFQGKNTFIRLI